jgi:hypothetical protein
MGKENGKGITALVLMSHAKNIGAGILVVLSILGAAYGSLKPETDAHETYEALAPEIDMMMELLDSNTLYLQDMEKKIIRLEAERQLIDGMLCGHFVNQQMVQSPKINKFKPEMENPPYVLEEREEPAPPPQQTIKAPAKRRKRSVPSWKK